MSELATGAQAEALAREHCHEIPRGTPALTDAEVASLRTAISAEWQLGAEGQALERAFRRPDFASAFGLATRVALLAEAERHHPDLEIGWGRLRIRLSTHSVGGLSRNDFILAARIDRLVA